MNAKQKALEICKQHKQEIAELLIKQGLVNVRFKKSSKNGLEVSISAKGRQALRMLGDLPQ